MDNEWYQLHYGLIIACCLLHNFKVITINDFPGMILGVLGVAYVFHAIFFLFKKIKNWFKGSAK